jgi:hypothetical protein
MNLRQLIGQKPIMTVPTLRDCDNYLKEDLVRQICRKCAEQLAPLLYRWEKSFPSKSCLKTYDKAQKCFLSMDLDLFQSFIEDYFSVRTADHEWLLDRSIAARIWAACIADDSPLPPADWAEEARRRHGA